MTGSTSFWGMTPGRSGLRLQPRTQAAELWSFSMIQHSLDHGEPVFHSPYFCDLRKAYAHGHEIISGNHHGRRATHSQGYSHNRTRDCNALPLASAQLAGALPGTIFQPNLFEPKRGDVERIQVALQAKRQPATVHRYRYRCAMPRAAWPGSAMAVHFFELQIGPCYLPSLKFIYNT
jgi:hypothetical protein